MKPPFLAWPGWPFLRFAWLLSLVNGAWFAFVYGGCDWLTAHRTLRVPIHLPIELSIPLVPGMVLAYLSIDLLFLMGPFIIRERREFAALIRGLALATFIAGIGFLLLPAVPAYAPPGDLGIWAGLFQFAHTVTLTYNMAPSLHVALSACCIAAFARHASRPGAFLLWSWAALIALSTLLTHMHHLIDVVTGWLLGLAAFSATVLRSQRSDAVQPTEPEPAALSA
jgi:membrane-associated phospholipid phosphatase